MFYSDKYGFEWNEELSEKIFEKSSIGMAFVSVQEGKFLRANEALCEMLDYTEWELLSKTWKDVTAGQDIDADLEAVAALKNGEKQQYHMRKKYITKGSEIIDCYLYVQCIYEDNSKQKIKYFLSMVTPCEVIIDKNKKICPVPAESSIMKDNDNFFINSLKQNWIQLLVILGTLIGMIYQYGQNQQKIENRISTLEKDVKAIVQKNEDVLEEIKEFLKNKE